MRTALIPSGKDKKNIQVADKNPTPRLANRPRLISFYAPSDFINPQASGLDDRS